MGLLSLLVPPVIGLLLMVLLTGPSRRCSAPLAANHGSGVTWFLVFLSWPMGWFVTATLFFLCSVIFVRPAVPSAIMELSLLALLGVITQRRHAASAAEPNSARQGNAARKRADLFSHGLVTSLLTALFMQLAIVALVVSIRAAAMEPYGSWDGWAIWNFHARFLHRAPVDWPALLQAPQVAWSHPDYPLLVPASVARLWAWLGRETAQGAAAVSLLFGVGTAGLLVTALHRRRGAVIALLAGIALLSTPFFVTFASNEHADIPLGLFMLAVCVVLAADDHRELASASSRAVLAGALIGCSASVKNEGQLFALIATGGFVGMGFREKTLRRSLFPFSAALLSALAPLLYFKLCLAPPNDLAASHPGQRLGLLFAASRHRLILAALWRDLPAFGQWRWVPYFPLALALVGSGWRRLGLRDWAVAALLVLTAAGYYGVYLLTPFDLQWHLDSSLVRLLMQLWPSALFFWGLAASPPASPPVTPTSPSPARVWAMLNLGCAALVVGCFFRQLAPNELAASRFHTIHAVPAGDWYPAEANGKSRWSWSSGHSTLKLISDAPKTCALRFGARGLHPQILTLRQNGQIVWSGPIGAQLRRIALPRVPAPSSLTFDSDQPGVPESSDARSRTLAFALYDLRIE